jgi:hypothetical protein
VKVNAVLRRPLISLALLAVLTAACGSSCFQRQEIEVIPTVLPTTPTLEQVINTINTNTSLVHNFTSMQGTLTVPGAPALSMTLSMEPPRRFRLRATMVVTGPEVDLGSNEELFWVWIRRTQPPALYYCRHDQFASSAARQLMPVAPEFIPEAMGLVRFNPADQPQGPFPVGANRLQIQSVYHGALGELRKVTVVDSLRGVVLEQHLYDARNARVASSFNSNFHRDPVTGAVLPRHVEIQYPVTQFDLKIDMVDMQINMLGPQNAQLWVKPDYPGFPNVNLADPNLPIASAGNLSGVPRPPAGSAAVTMAPANASPAYANPPYANSAYANPAYATPANSVLLNARPVVTTPGTPAYAGSPGATGDPRLAAQPAWGAGPGGYPAAAAPPPGYAAAPNYAPASGYAPTPVYKSAPQAAAQGYAPYP